MDAEMNREAVLALLRLQVEWGVDVAVDEAPHDRFAESAEEMARRAARHSAGAVAGTGALPVREREVRPAARVTEGPPSRMQQAPVAVAPPSAELEAAETPEALLRAVEASDVCPLRGTAMHSVVPRGPVGARVMVIGDAPDEDEDRSGVPFSGLSGQLLDQMLRSIGLKREELVVGNVVPWRPPGGRPPSQAEVVACLPLLLQAIRVFRPERLLLCGSLATRMLLGGVMTGRGTGAAPPRRKGAWQQTVWDAAWGPPLPALSVRHPLQLRASAAARREIWSDLLFLAVTLDEERSDPV